ncbi:hypothetical protein E2C01_087439 [Portunus trituberculatus]|uniref:Uncharacterized protein n=1 Tax=Portunus trituberculatus TaxID=210409 RepID=A0A5B7JCH5_PORTR|nr:hypothetical protein [Portunus trituberculatus]
MFIPYLARLSEQRGEFHSRGKGTRWKDIKAATSPHPTHNPAAHIGIKLTLTQPAAHGPPNITSRATVPGLV